MGLIKALTSATSSALGDQFKEFISCPTVANDVLIQRGIVQHGEGNKNFTDGVISNGSTIAVPQGMAMMIIDNGEIKEFTAEPGTFTWDTSTEPSIFTGGLGQGILNTFKTLGKRFTYGGQEAKDQRVYFVNIKTIVGNTFGSAQPETIYDPVYGSVEITYNGEYAIKVADPVIFVNNIIGANPKDTITFDDAFKVDGKNMLKSKFAQKVSEAISNIMVTHNVSFNRIQAYKGDVTDQMNKILDEEWTGKYGIVVEDVALRINASEESRRIVQEMDADVARTTRMGQVYSDNMVGTMAAASAEAMKGAANNEGGAMMGFMGMNLANMQANNVMGTAAQVAGTQTAQAAPAPQPAPGTVFGGVAPVQTPAVTFEEPVLPASTEAAAPAPAAPTAPSAPVAKFCPNCGVQATGNFCSQCGTKLN